MTGIVTIKKERKEKDNYLAGKFLTAILDHGTISSQELSRELNRSSKAIYQVSHYMRLKGLITTDRYKGHQLTDEGRVVAGYVLRGLTVRMAIKAKATELPKVPNGQYRFFPEMNKIVEEESTPPVHYSQDAIESEKAAIEHATESRANALQNEVIFWRDKYIHLAELMAQRGSL